MSKFWGGMAAAIALMSAPAQAACWDSTDVSAASVRELQSLLMVATLRCHAAGHDIAGDYNEFLRANRTTIIGMNDRLKAHFIRAEGPVDGQRAYDSFTTSMANGYGAAASGADVCAAMAAVTREAGLMAGSVEGLVMIADREALPVDLPGGRCERVPMTIASASTARSIAAAVQPNGTPMIAARVSPTPALVHEIVEPAAQPAPAAPATPLDPAVAMAGISYTPGH